MTTTSATSASSGSAILAGLSANNGIDTGSLVTSLVSATYDPKTAAVTAKQTTNTAKISSVATLTAGIDSFASALSSLISGGTLFTQPTSSNSAVLTATTKAGAQIGNLTAQLSVRQIAQAQSLVSGYVATAGTAVGTGSLTIATGATSVNITVDSTNNTLAGVARAINASKAGVTATVVTDANGARLSIKGSTGAANAFTITPGANSDPALSALAFGVTGMTASGAAVVSPSFKRSDAGDPATAPVGQGTMTLGVGGNTATLTIDPSNDSLNGLRDQINNAGLGLTAAIVTDGSGARLSITDGSGNPPNFTLTANAGAQAGLQRLAYPQDSTGGMTKAQSAQDAIVRMDGVDVTRGSNAIDDLIDGVTLNLVSAAPTETVSLTATRPTDAIKQAVGDFVAAYNEMKQQIDAASASSVIAADGSSAQGPLYNNSAIRQMQTMLARLPSTVLSTTGGPSTLAEIGVSTNRDGTLSLNSAMLTKQLATYPDSVEAMFNPTQHSSNPLIKITSAMGAAKPGTYQLTDIVAQTGGHSSSGKIDGYPLLSTGAQLYGSTSYKPGLGFSFEASGDVASATITVDLGLGGALQAIRDSLRSTGGVFDSLSSQLTKEKTDLTGELAKINTDSQSYRDQLTTQFSAMSTRVAAFKATQSYLQQQIDVWTKSDN